MDKPEVKDQNLENPNWLAGFASAEGCFRVKVAKSNTKTRETVSLGFQFTQHAKDEKLMRNLIKYLYFPNEVRARKYL